MVINSKMKIGSPSDLRRVHRSLILRAIFSGTGHSRTQLAGQSGLSTMAITRIIRELIDVGVIKEMGKRNRDGNPGRKQTELSIQANGAYVVALVISAFGHEIAVIDASGNTVIKQKLLLSYTETSESCLRSISESITSLIDDAKIQKDRVLGIGVSIAAFVESSTGTVIKAPYLGWEAVELGREITQCTGLPLIAENIADAINLAEQTTNNLDNSAGVFLVHTSVACGASYTHQGDLVRGANFSAGQIGHLPVSNSELTCSCGASDCLNTHSSGWSVLAKLGRTNSKTYNPKNNDTYANALNELIAENPSDESPEGRVLYHAGKQLGNILRNISLIVDPGTIVLAGKLPESPAYVAGCKDTWAELSANQLRRAPQLITGHVAPIQAAGLLALNSFLFSPALDITSLSKVSEGAEKGYGT